MPFMYWEHLGEKGFFKSREGGGKLGKKKKKKEEGGGGREKDLRTITQT